MSALSVYHASLCHGGRVMSIVFRPAHADELQRAEELVVRSINDLTERHGFGPMASLRPPDFQLFSLKDDPDGSLPTKASSPSRSTSCRRDCIFGTACFRGCQSIWSALHVTPLNADRANGPTSGDPGAARCQYLGYLAREASPLPSPRWHNERCSPL